MWPFSKVCFVDVINLFVCNNDKYCRNYGNRLYINLPECRGEPRNETKLITGTDISLLPRPSVYCDNWPINQSDCWLQNSSVLKKLYYIHQTPLPSFWLRVWERDQVVTCSDSSSRLHTVYICFTYTQ